MFTAVIKKKYDFDPDNGLLKVLCTILEDEKVLLDDVIAKIDPENYEVSLRSLCESKVSEYFALEVQKQEKVQLVNQIEVGAKIELKVEKPVQLEVVEEVAEAPTETEVVSE